MEKVKKITEGKVALPNVQNLAQALMLNTGFYPQVPPCGWDLCQVWCQPNTKLKGLISASGSATHEASTGDIKDPIDSWAQIWWSTAITQNWQRGPHTLAPSQRRFWRGLPLCKDPSASFPHLYDSLFPPCTICTQHGPTKMHVPMLPHQDVSPRA